MTSSERDAVVLAVSSPPTLRNASVVADLLGIPERTARLWAQRRQEEEASGWGMGLPRLNGKETGDQLVKVVVEVPKKISKAQRKVIEEFDQAMKPDAMPAHEEFKRLVDRLRPASNN